MGHHYHITMALGSAPILIMLLAAAAGVATAWEELAGVCGAPSGYHAGTAATRCSGLQSHSYRGTAMCTGTYAVEFSDVVYPTASTSGSMTVRLANGAGRFNTEGLLFQAYDSATGLPIPDSPGFTNLPRRTKLYDGCPSPEHAVSHSGELDGRGALSFTFQWSGVGVAPAFIAFPTDEDIFYVTRPTCLLGSPADCDSNGGSCASTTNCPYPGPFPDESCPAGAPVTTHLHAVAIWGAVALMAMLGMVMRVPGLYRVRAWMTTVRPLTFFGCTRARFWHPTSGKSKGMASLAPFLLREATLDFFPRLWGITAAEALCICLFTAGQALGMMLYATRVKGQPAVEVFSRALAAAAEVNFGVLLLPICRNTPLTLLAGTSFERTVKYHRILARYTMALVAAHLFYAIGHYKTDAFSLHSTCYGLGNLYGLICFACFMALAVLAHDFVRRRWYELFKHSHIILFWPGIIAACLHSQTMVFYISPGLVLYLGDHLMRAVSWGRRGALLVGAKEVGAGIVELTFAITKAGFYCEAGSYVFIDIPQVGRGPMDFHPLTISSFETTGAKSGTMTVHIKSAGPGTWTDRLQQKVNQAAKLRAWIEGPYGKLSVDLNRYKTVIASSGGIGVTPMIPLLRMVSNPESRSLRMKQLQKLVWIWTVRDFTDIQPFEEQICDAINLSKGVLDVRIYVTKAPLQKPTENESSAARLVKVVPPSKLQDEELAATEAVSGTTQIPAFSGRPPWGTLYKEIVSGFGDSSLPGNGVCSLVCGPGQLVLDVQHASSDQGIHVHEETFAW